jgi:hypothetical protein
MFAFQMSAGVAFSERQFVTLLRYETQQLLKDRD